MCPSRRLRRGRCGQPDQRDACAHALLTPYDAAGTPIRPGGQLAAAQRWQCISCGAWLRFNERQGRLAPEA